MRVRVGSQHREGISEDAGLAAHRVVVGPRERNTRFVVGSYPLLQLHGKQLAGAPHGIDTKKEDVVDREDHGDEPEAERHRRDDREGGERRAAERAERVPDVASQVVDDTGAASVATLVGGQRHRAEARERPGASIDGAQTGGDVLLRLALDVERELLVELAFDAARSHQRANPQEQVAEVHAAHASFITRADGRGHALPLAGFHRQLPASGWREPVVLRPPAQLRDGPLGFDPALVLEAMERRIQRALVDLQDVLGDLLDALRDRPAVQRFGLQRPKDEQVEGARKQVGDGVSRHGVE